MMPGMVCLCLMPTLLSPRMTVKTFSPTSLVTCRVTKLSICRRMSAEDVALHVDVSHPPPGASLRLICMCTNPGDIITASLGTVDFGYGNDHSSQLRSLD